MDEDESLSHTQGEGTYPVVFIGAAFMGANDIQHQALTLEAD
jgi:hypothetical protein